VRVTRPSPVPSSGFLPLSTDLAALAARTLLPSPHGDCSHAVRRGAPTLRSLVPCCSRPLESPFRAFPSRGAVPALAGPFSLVGSRRPPNGAARSEGFATPFACCADLSPRLARRLAGLQGRDKGSLESLGRRACHVAVVVCDVSSRSGRARRTRLPARPLRSFALLESPFADSDRRPGQGAVNRSVLSWVSSPLERSPAARGSGMRVVERRSGRARASFILEIEIPDQAFRQVVDPAGGSRTHGPPTSPVDRTGRRHRRAAHLLASGF